MTAKIVLTWADFEEAVEALATALHLAPLPQDTEIVAEPRGGLPLAVALSHRLGLPFTLNPTPGVPVLWVDDILDTGTTLCQMQRRAPTAREIQPVVWVNKQPVEFPILHYIGVPPTTWVVFPWEGASPDAIAADRAAYETRIRTTPETKPARAHARKATS